MTASRRQNPARSKYTHMPKDNAIYSSQGHLAYYLKHGLSPTNYDTRDLLAHLQRRESLYRSLGLPPAAFSGARVLEVAAGTGQNSLYVASCMPSALTLLEPNPVARGELGSSYAEFVLPHTRPVVEPKLFQDFSSSEPFDIVICENWLGHLPDDRALVRKLGQLVAPGGALVMTMMPMPGFIANVIRKIMADLIVRNETDFATRGRVLADAFGPHLATITGMTRSHASWIADCMLNPHFLNVVIPPAVIVEELGEELDVLSTNPVFQTDWRWFKTLHGDNRRFNDSFLESYLRNSHNFIDYQHTYPPRSIEDNRRIEQAALAVHNAGLEIEKQLNEGGNRSGTHLLEFAESVGHFAASIADLDPDLGRAFSEAKGALAKPDLSAHDIAGLKLFGPIFGRETVYVSLTRGKF